MDISSDDELMVGVGEGKPRAFEELFHRHGAKILGYACRLLGGDRVKAEDISQMVWVKIVKAAPNYQGRGHFIAWVYTIVRHTVFSETQRKSQYLETEWDENSLREWERGNISRASFENEMTRTQNLREMKKAIDELPEAQRLAILMWMTEDLSYEEIARQLDTSLASVKSLIFRARQNLKLRLGGVA